MQSFPSIVKGGAPLSGPGSATTSGLGGSASNNNSGSGIKKSTGAGTPVLPSTNRAMGFAKPAGQGLTGVGSAGKRTGQQPLSSRHQNGGGDAMDESVDGPSANQHQYTQNSQGQQPVYSGGNHSLNGAVPMNVAMAASPNSQQGRGMPITALPLAGLAHSPAASAAASARAGKPIGLGLVDRGDRESSQTQSQTTRDRMQMEQYNKEQERLRVEKEKQLERQQLTLKQQQAVNNAVSPHSGSRQPIPPSMPSPQSAAAAAMYSAQQHASVSQQQQQQQQQQLQLQQQQQLQLQQQQQQVVVKAAPPKPKPAMTPAETMRKYAELLTPFEQSEILEYQQIYFVGLNLKDKIKGIPHTALNNGYDDDRGDYKINMGDHLEYRYEVLSVLGRGSFGQVLKVFDHKKDIACALKIIRNKKRFHHQALVEVKILEHLMGRDKEHKSNIVRVHGYFYFRNHLMITFEPLSINLYEFIKNNNFKGISLGLIRRFAVQLLQSLKFLKGEGIIHCDLKPENILLRSPNKSTIKLIDFGSSCFPERQTRVATEKGFMGLGELEARVERGETIRYACYEARTKKIVYCTGQIVMPKKLPTHLVDFSAGRRQEKTTKADGLTILTTPDHQMYTPDAAGQYRKIAAEQLTQQSAAQIRMMANAPNGFQPQRTLSVQDVDPSSPLYRLNLTTPTQVDAFLLQYGRSVVDGLQLWVLERLTGEQVRTVLRGVAHTCIGKSTLLFTTPSIHFREQLLQAALHAGYSARFHLLNEPGQQPQQWVISMFTQSIELSIDAADILHHGTSLTSSASSSLSSAACVYSPALHGRIWCVQVDHPDHLIFAHRIESDGKGAVVQAARPIIVGNCFSDERVYTYIQSRFYRSPEVILGLPYDESIDCWSLGCILSELYTGYPLFPGENETEQMQVIMEVLGPPPKRLIQECTRKKAFFDATGKPLIVPNTRGKIRQPGTKDLAQATKCNDPQFLSFLKRLLRWDPKVRMTPEKAFEHPWISESAGAPQASGASTMAPTKTGGGSTPSQISQVGYSVSMQGQVSSRGEKVQAKVNSGSGSSGENTARQSASIAVQPHIAAQAAASPQADHPMSTDSPSGNSTSRRPKPQQPTTGRRPSISGTSGTPGNAARALFPSIAGAKVASGAPSSGQNSGQVSSRNPAFSNQNQSNSHGDLAAMDTSH